MKYFILFYASVCKCNWFLSVDFAFCNFFEFITLTCFFFFLRILYSFLHIRSYHLPIEIILHLFPIWLHFISLSCLISLIRTSSTMLNKSGKSRYPYLIPDLRGKTFSLSPLSMLDIGFSCMAFIMLRRLLSIPSLLSVFIIKGCWILSSAFFCINWD